MLGTVTDWLNTVAAGVWLGGLAAFLALLAVGVRAIQAEQRTALLAAAIPRFSLLAVAAVATLALTGALQWLLRVGNLNDTFNSDYGQCLVAKTVLLLPMVGLGAANLWIISPCFHSAVTCLSERAQSLLRGFRRTVTLELILGMSILAATAFLTDTSPPGEATPNLPSTAVVREATDADLDVSLTVTPAVAGPNEIRFELEDTEDPIQEVRNVIVRFRYLEDDLGQTEAEPQLVAPGSFLVSGSQLGVPGNWEILLIVQRLGVADVRLTFEVEVAVQ